MVGPPTEDEPAVSDRSGNLASARTPSAARSTGRRARAAAKRLISPVERFLSIEASSGILLLVAALVALAWANSPWRSAYESLLHTPLGLRLGSFASSATFISWSTTA